MRDKILYYYRNKKYYMKEKWKTYKFSLYLFF